MSNEPNKFIANKRSLLRLRGSIAKWTVGQTVTIEYHNDEHDIQGQYIVRDVEGDTVWLEKVSE